ncbi:MAG: hypothetical protein J5736_05770, partial [Bacilli bacterium]|nr:hypothetical protein [Bacilli bacterium]
MVTTLVLSLICFLGIACSILFFPEIKLGRVRVGTYWLIALFGAVVFLLSGLAPIEEVLSELTSEGNMNPLKILVLFFSMTLLSVFLDEVGLFSYLASLATRKANKNQFTLFFILYALTALLTVFTSNDIVILTFTPFICFFCKSSKINPIPYLVAEFTAANTWSLMLLIGNPTNIYLASAAGIGFFDYFKTMALPTLLAGGVEFSVLLLLFHRKLRIPLQAVEEEAHIENKPALALGLIHLLVCLLFLILSGYLQFPMWAVASICAGSLFVSAAFLFLIKRGGWHYLGGTIRKLPYPLIPFFLSMFVIVVALNEQGISEKIASLLGKGNPIWTYGFSSFFVSNLINNIPMS